MPLSSSRWVCGVLCAAVGFLALAAPAAPGLEIAQEEVISPQFITADKQARLTPQRVLATLRERNREFVSGSLTVRNTSERIRKAASGQHPGAVILSCLDSRIPVEDVFHSGIGDLFVARVAGNIVTPEILGSLEFACKVSGAKVVIIMGHENCGAIKAAIDGVELGNITTLLRPIRSAMEQVGTVEGVRTSKNPAYVEAVCHANVRDAIRRIREQSPILREMEAKKEILITGAEYHLGSGRVDFLEP